MSLEQALYDTTAAVNKLTSLLAAAQVAPVGVDIPVKAPAKGKATKAPATEPATTAETPATSTPSPTSAPAAAESKPAATPAKDFDRQPSIDALMKVARTKSKAAAVKLLGEFGVTKATELKTAEDAAKFIAAAEEVLNPTAGDGSDLI